MKNKKTTNHTRDLLVKLGASLKESPLVSHARVTETPAVKDFPSETQRLRETVRTLVDPESAGAAAVVAGQLALRQAAREVLREDPAEKAQTTVPPSPENGRAPLAQRQGFEAKQLEAALSKMGSLQEMLEQMHRTPASDGFQSSPSQLPYRPGMTGYAAGSNRRAPSGWRTSTVGLYPEDYEKAHAAMSYLLLQTGQSVNLSRVVKIALRNLEVGPGLLELDAQIKAKDGRRPRG